MAKKRTWYVVVDGVVDNRVGCLGAEEEAALAVWRKSKGYTHADLAGRGVRAVPRDGRFSVVSQKTRRAPALSDTGLSLTEAIARYHQRRAATDAFTPTVLIGDDRSHALTVGRTRDVWELTFTPSPTTAPRNGKPRRFAFYVLYQEKPGGLLHERTNIDSEPEAERAVQAALRDAETGSYAVVWRAPYQESTPWMRWRWERFLSYLKTGPRNVIRVNPVTALAPIPRQPYLDRDADGQTGARRYLVSTEMDVYPVGDQFRATGMHVGTTYEGWGKTGRAAVRALKAAIEAADPSVQITRARTRR